MPAVVVEPISVGLQFGFLAVLYLFLLWVSRSALKDLRNPPRRSVPTVATDVATDATGLHPASQAVTALCPTSGLSEGMVPSRSTRRIFPLPLVRQVPK